MFAVPCGEQKAPVTRYFLSSVSFSRNKTLVSMFFILFSLNRKAGGGGNGKIRVRPGLETWVSCQLWDISPSHLDVGVGLGTPLYQNPGTDLGSYPFYTADVS